MNILFTPAGDTDPVRGYHDGAMLHILRHYPVDRVVLFLTDDMGKREKRNQLYTKGIHSVKPDCPIDYVYSNITDPQDYEKLTPVQDAFDKAYNQYPDADWLLNISSATPQIKSVVSILSLDYNRAKAIQVVSPAKGSNRETHPEVNEDDIDMLLELNEDRNPDSPNRCSEPALALLKRHGLCLQIESLIKNYEYDGALQLAIQNKRLLSDTTIKLLQHASYRSNLQWKAANKVIAQYNGQPLMHAPGDFSEYFQVMELRQRKHQLPDFIVKLSPVLVELGKQYLQQLPGFDLEKCGGWLHWNGNDEFRISRNHLQKNYPDLLKYLEKTKVIHDIPVYFWFIVAVCEFYRDHALKGDDNHSRITDIFIRLRTIEGAVRNDMAHEITNLTEEKLQAVTAGKLGQGLKSADIMKLLREAVKLIRHQNIIWSYNQLNNYISDSLHYTAEA